MAAAQWSSSPQTRPQLPFLVIPSSRPSAAAQPQQHRYFTTKRRRWLQYEALAFAKYTLYFWAAVGCLVLGQFVFQQEWMERAHPTPPDWSFMSRFRLRGALTERDGDGGGPAGPISEDDLATDVRVVDHVKIIQILLDLLARLEDPRVDGQGLPPCEDVAENSFQARDIRGQPEPWRRGYFQTLLAAAETSEHVEGWLRDRTRNLVCPPDMVVGPSNPHPRPLPPGASGHPREEDCEPCFPAPATLYRKLLHTRGLTAHQQITAALAFANYLEYKQDRAAAADVYARAVQVARQQDATTTGDTVFALPVDDLAAWLRDWTEHHAADGTASVNLLHTLTAYATFQARTGDVDAALPIFVALLQARRALPPGRSVSTASATADAVKTGFLARLKTLLTPPTYPPPPDDGFGPPLPGPHARCDEAALQLHIGEILYASARAGSAGSSSTWVPSFGSHQRQAQQAREQGIAWTREAVDMAEEQLHALQNEEKDQARAAGLLGVDADHTTTAAVATSRATCRECLVAGLDNWTAMVAQLARDEERRQAEAAATAASVTTSTASTSSSYWPSWLTLWGDRTPPPASINGGRGSGETTAHRWAAEEQVIRDRRRRAKELLDSAAPPAARGMLSMLVA